VIPVSNEPIVAQERGDSPSKARPAQGDADGQDPKKDRGDQGAGDVPRVKICHPILRDIAGYSDFTGRIEPAMFVELRPRVSGMLTGAHVVADTLVKNGDLLFEIDERPYTAEVQKARAEIQQLEAKLKIATTELERLKRLEKQGPQFVSKAEIEKAEAEAAAAVAAVAVGKASLDLANLNLSFTRITAPIDGRITAPLVNLAQVVDADKTLLVTIYSVDPMYVYFDVDERTIVNLNRARRDPKMKAELVKGLPVQVGLVDEDDFPHTGRANVVVAKIDPEKGTARLRAALRNLDGILLPGLFARVRMRTSPAEPRLWVPRSAVLGADSFDPSPNVLLVNEKNVVAWRKVDARPEAGGYVITQGLTADDWIVVDAKRVKAGTTVTTEKVDAPEPSPPASAGRDGARRP
jgi:multidrug efflux system membrane fusion protein